MEKDATWYLNNIEVAEEEDNELQDVQEEEDDDELQDVQDEEDNELQDVQEEEDDELQDVQEEEDDELQDVQEEEDDELQDVQVEEDDELQDVQEEDDDELQDVQEEEAEGGEKKKKGRRPNTYLPGIRKARLCCMCGSTYLYLAQHLRRQHRVKDESRLALLMGKARELDPISQSGKSSTCARGYPCGYPSCSARGLKRLDVHLQSQHGLKRKGPQYCYLLKSVNFKRGRSFRERKAKNSSKNSAVVSVDLKCQKPSEEDVLGSFEEYIYAANGCNSGARRTARASRRNLELLSSHLGVAVPKLLTPAMPQKIVTLLTNRMRPGTLTKYLHSIKNFCFFLTLYEENAKFLNISQAVLHKTIRMSTDFIHSISGRVAARQAEVKAKINDLVISGSNVKNSVERVDEELRTLTSGKTGKPDWATVRRARNLIMFKILLTQAPRPCVLSNATLGQYQQRKTVVAPETFEEMSVIEVRHHKTAKKGPASIIVNETLDNQLKFYVRHLRPYTKDCQDVDINADDSCLFLDANGATISKVSYETESVWTSFGNDGIRCTATIIRKTAATKVVRELSRKEADSVAEFMAHRPETQRMYYVAHQNVREKVRASNSLSTIMQMEDPDVQPRHLPVMQPSPSALDEDDQPSLKNPDLSSSSGVSCQPASEVSLPEKSSVPVKTFYKLKATTRNSKGKTYTKMQESQLMEHYESFRGEVGTGFMQAATFIKESDNQFANFTPKQLADKIRHTVDSGRFKDECTAQGAETCSRMHQQVVSDDALAIASVIEVDIKKYVQRNIQYLREVSCGRVESWRHRDYKIGGSRRANLTYAVYGPPFTEDQQEWILKELMAVFSPGSTRLLDYVAKVMVQEAMIKICQDILGITIKEAVDILEKPVKY